MNWLYYLLEANCYLLVFYAFYRLFLHDETFYSSNRYFLIFTSLLAFLLPLVQIGWLKPATVTQVVGDELILTEAIILNQTPIQETFDFTILLYPVYLLVAGVFATKLIMGLSKIISLWLRAEKQRSGEVTVVRLHENAAFSFFNLLFIHPHLANKKAVVAHEMVHIKQKHSLDILFFELLQVLCWFNPIIYFLKKDIKLLHEYIADELSTGTEMQKHEYAMFLIENSFGVSQTALTNQIFNQSILKRRINMLNKKRTAARARLRLLLAIPLTLGMLCASTLAFTKDYGYIDLLPENSATTLSLVQTTPEESEKKTEPAKVTARTVKAGKSIKPNSTHDVYFRTRKDPKSGKQVPAERKLIIINDEVTNDEKLYGVKNAQKVELLPGTQAVKIYGEKAVNGAVVISGKQLEFVKTPIPPTTGTKNDAIIYGAAGTRAIVRGVSGKRHDSVWVIAKSGDGTAYQTVRDSSKTARISIVRDGHKDRIWIRKDTSKRLNLSVRKTEPTRVIRVSEIKDKNVRAKVTGVQVSPREVVEVRAITSTPPQVAIGRPPKAAATTVTGKEVKEVRLIPTKTTGTAKTGEVIEVKILPSVKVTELPAKGNN